MLTVQARANPGELGLHDVMLHLWMSVCGDSLVAMRALSALAGTIAIVLVYLVAREVLVSDAADNGESAAGQRNLAAAIATLFFAVNLITIKYSREARMYSLALMLSLLQVWFFLRALRKAGTADYVGLAATTGLTFIATFTAGLILVPEGLFLLLISAQRAGSWPRLMRIGAAVATGLLLVIPSLLLSVHLRGSAPSAQTWEWIPRPAPWATVTLFSKATGTYAFPLLAILAAAGALRGRRGRRNALNFLLLWTLAPPVFLTIFSYLLQPAFVERYMLCSFVPFFAFAALGVLQSQPASLRPGAIALVVVLSLMHLVGWTQKTHGLQWATATAAATDALKPGDAIGVAPRAGINVVRYYVRDRHPAITVEDVDAQPAPAVVIVTDAFGRDQTAALAQRYPRILASLHEVVIRAH